ncbi:MAG: Chromosomal replication initiator protein DnaA [Chlamydiae bacterium]|nr:Chromosomal replication initiator protein DnaA [Chlamydiota bacterium]
MLVCETQECWTQFLEYVKDRCSATAFGNWLAPIMVKEGAEDEITLEVPNIFVQEYLLSNYHKELCMFLPVHEDGSPAVNFEIKAPKKEPIPMPANLPKTVPPPSPPTNFYEVKLNHRYKFSSFIEGASNQFIKSAAIGVADRPGKSYNPLFIHGGVGLGKTHILHSIGHHIADNQKNMRIQMITTEGFINDLVDNLRRKTVDKMKRFYRSEIDVLLIDDIQFLQNRLNFEEEFCILLDHYANNGKQVVLTCDKPPSQLKLSERMKARMEWGLVAHMGVPDLETRVAIMKHKAEQKGLDLPNEIAFFIAEHLYNNVRQLEGAVNRLNAHCRLLNTQITRDLVVNTMGEMFQQSPKNLITVEQVLKSVATIFQVRVSDLKSATRTKSVAIARQVAMYLAKMLVNDSLMSLGVYFNKTHSTILHACKTIEQKIKEDEMLKRQIDLVKRNLEC